MDARKSFIYDGEEDEFENGEGSSNVMIDDRCAEKTEVNERVQTEIPFSFGPYTFGQRVISSLSDPMIVEGSSGKKRNLLEANLEPGNKGSLKSKKPLFSIEEDEDYHFVMSILPSLRNVSNKMKVRMDIMNIIIAAKKNDN